MKINVHSFFSKLQQAIDTKQNESLNNLIVLSDAQ